MKPSIALYNPFVVPHGNAAHPILRLFGWLGEDTASAAPASSEAKLSNGFTAHRLTYLTGARRKLGKEYRSSCPGLHKGCHREGFPTPRDSKPQQLILSLDCLNGSSVHLALAQQLQKGTCL